MKTKLIMTAIVTFFVSDAIAVTRANRYIQKRNALLMETIELMGNTLEEISISPENAQKILDDHAEQAVELAARMVAFSD